MGYSKIELINICKSYKYEEKESYILKNISISFSVGKIYAIVGKSGSGKTSLLNIIGCIDTSYKGIYRYNGESINKRNINQYRNKRISYSTQNPVLFSNLNISQNINLPLVLDNREITNRVLENKTLKYNMFFKLKEKIKNLSYGQKQRIDFIRNIELSKKIIILDETLSGIDVENKNIIGSELQKIKANKIVIIVTHDSDFIKKYADEVFEIKDGKIYDNNKIISNKYYKGIKTNFKKQKPSLKIIASIALSFFKANIKRIITYVSLLSTAFTGLILIFLLSQTFTMYFNRIVDGEYIKDIYSISTKNSNIYFLNDNSSIVESGSKIYLTIKGIKVDISEKVNYYSISKETISPNSMIVLINSDYLRTLTDHNIEYINEYLNSNIYNITLECGDRKIQIRLSSLKLDNSIDNFSFSNSDNNWNVHIFKQLISAEDEYTIKPCQRFLNKKELDEYIINNSTFLENIEYDIYDNCLVTNLESVNKFRKSDIKYLVEKYGGTNIIPCSIKQGIYCNELTGEIKIYIDYKDEMYEINYKLALKEDEISLGKISSNLKELLKENYFTLSGSNYSIDVGNLDIFESQSNEIIVYKNILIMEKFIDELDTNFVFIHSNNNSIKEETKFNVANIYDNIKKPIDSLLKIVTNILFIFFLVSLLICFIGLVTIEFLDINDKKRQIGYLQSLGWGDLNIYKIIQFENILKSTFSSCLIIGLLFLAKFNIETIFLNFLKEEIIISIFGYQILIIVTLIFSINFIAALIPFLRVIKTSPLDNLNS